MKLRHRRGWHILGGLAVTALFTGWIACGGSAMTVVITTDYAQQQIDAALAKHEASNPKVHVAAMRINFADNRAYVTATAWGTSLHHTLRADIAAVGALDYHDGAFYFRPTKPIKFDHVQVAKVTPTHFAQTRALLAAKAHQYLAEHDVGDDWENISEAVQADFKQWATTNAETAITMLLTHHPLYTLKDNATGFIVRTALDNVQVVGNELHVTVSVARVGYTILLTGLCVIAFGGLLVAMIIEPEWLLALDLLA